jgi:hypothetical protein
MKRFDVNKTLLRPKAVYLKSDIQTDSKIRAEQIDTITTSLENDLPKLYEMIKGESGDREVHHIIYLIYFFRQESDNALLKRAGDEIRRLNEAIANQKKLR